MEENHEWLEEDRVKQTNFYIEMPIDYADWHDWD